MIVRLSPPSLYAFLPLSSSSAVAWSDLLFRRESMNCFTTVVASSTTVGSGGSAGATATQSEEPRTYANELPSGAQSGR